jgi:hypothetical protein
VKEAKPIWAVVLVFPLRSAATAPGFHCTQIPCSKVSLEIP